MALEIAMVALILILLLVLFLYKRVVEENKRLASIIENLNFDKKSLSVKYGKLTEQLMPFGEIYPYNPDNFRFIGSPIDGIQFEEDKVIFIEFKSGDSRLTVRQEQIREIVEGKKVEFREIRIK